MRYAEYLPDPRLRMLVRCYWVFESDPDSPVAGHPPDETIVPDGHPELVFHYGESFSEIMGDGSAQTEKRQPASLFAGQITRPLVLRANGAAGMISARFQPWGARLLLGVPMSETTDEWLAIDDLPGHWLDGVHDAICIATTDRARIEALERAFLARVARTPSRSERKDRGHRSDRSDRSDEMIAACVATLRRPVAGVRLDTLGARFGLSTRQLERRFNDAVGMSPKLLASIFRFRALFEALNASARAPWLAAAIDAGYFDQAHMIRDFRRFAGAPPQSFYRSISGLSAALVNAGDG